MRSAYLRIRHETDIYVVVKPTLGIPIAGFAPTASTRIFAELSYGDSRQTERHEILSGSLMYRGTHVIYNLLAGNCYILEGEDAAKAKRELTKLSFKLANDGWDVSNLNSSIKKLTLIIGNIEAIRPIKPNPSLQLNQKWNGVLEEFVLQKVKEVIVGDVFQNIQGSTIVNRSMIEKSFNKVQSGFDESTALALVQVAEHIARSGNKEAAEMFSAFNEELQKDEPKKPVLRSLWDGMVRVLPDLATLADAASKISQLFTL